MSTLQVLGIVGAGLLCAAYVGCASSPRQAQVAVDQVACYELRHTTETHPSAGWPGFESGIISLDPAAIGPVDGRNIPADARAARWLVRTYTRDAEEAIIVAMRRLDEIEGRDTVIAPRDSLLRRAEARWRDQPGAARYWYPLGQDSLVIVELMGDFSTVVRLHVSNDGRAAGIARFHDPALAHPILAETSEFGLVGSRVVCPT